MDYIEETAVIKTTDLPVSFREKVDKTEDIQEITREKLLIFLQSLNGQFISIDFIKKDGTFRTLNGRLGVKRHAQGKASDIHHLDSPYICVYEVPKPKTGVSGGYRYVNLHTIIAIRAAGKDIFVN